jgi:hypothetical protein
MHLRIARRGILIVDVLFCKIIPVFVIGAGMHSQIVVARHRLATNLAPAKVRYLSLRRNFTFTVTSRSGWSSLRGYCWRIVDELTQLATEVLEQDRIGCGNVTSTVYTIYRRRSAPRQYRAASNARKVIQLVSTSVITWL